MEPFMDAFFKQCVAMIANETKKATAAMVTKTITSTLGGYFSRKIQIRYTYANGGKKESIFHLAVKALIYVVQKGRVETFRFAERKHLMNELV